MWSYKYMFWEQTKQFNSNAFYMKIKMLNSETLEKYCVTRSILEIPIFEYSKLSIFFNRGNSSLAKIKIFHNQFSILNRFLIFTFKYM